MPNFGKLVGKGRAACGARATCSPGFSNSYWRSRRWPGLFFELLGGPLHLRCFLLLRFVGHRPFLLELFVGVLQLLLPSLQLLASDCDLLECWFWMNLALIVSPALMPIRHSVSWSRKAWCVGIEPAPLQRGPVPRISAATEHAFAANASPRPEPDPDILGGALFELHLFLVHSLHWPYKSLSMSAAPCLPDA